MVHMCLSTAVDIRRQRPTILVKEEFELGIACEIMIKG